MNEQRQNSEDAGLSTADIAGTSDRVRSNDTVEMQDQQSHDGTLSTPQDRTSSTEQSIDSQPLLPDGSIYQTRWQDIQGTFVDDPRDSVSKADGLVAEVIQTLAKRFAEEREHLEHDWSGGGEPSTEDLRQAMQHYRSFFQRLLAA